MSGTAEPHPDMRRLVGMLAGDRTAARNPPPGTPVFVDPETGLARLATADHAANAVISEEDDPDSIKVDWNDAIQAAKRATLPPPPKHCRQRAPVDRDAFVAKRDAKRRMRKASRRATRG